jgi:hypothetical protein
MNTKFRTIEDIKQQGFQGFVKMEELMRDQSKIPDRSGVYMVLYLSEALPVFINPGTGGFFKGDNPNVSSEVLIRNWVKDTKVVYIGKAGGFGSKATLKKRLSQYLRFGQGGDVGHYGGRLIWQIKDSRNLVICWKSLLSAEPRFTEAILIKEFVSQYCKLPFANLTN